MFYRQLRYICSYISFTETLARMATSFISFFLCFFFIYKHALMHYHKRMHWRIAKSFVWQTDRKILKLYLNERMRHFEKSLSCSYLFIYLFSYFIYYFIFSSYTLCAHTLRISIEHNFNAKRFHRIVNFKIVHLMLLNNGLRQLSK